MSDDRHCLDYWIRERAEIERELSQLDLEACNPYLDDVQRVQLAIRGRALDARHEHACAQVARYQSRIHATVSAFELAYLWTLSLLLGKDDCHADC